MGKMDKQDTQGIKLEDIKFRIAQTGIKDGQGWATCLIYIDARTANRELNKKYGEGNWMFKWEEIGSKFAVKGILKVFNKRHGMWLTYEDVGYAQDSKKFDWKSGSKEVADPDTTECLKDAVSDAKKRCCVQVGIGEMLYEAPLLWTQKVIVKDDRVKKLSPIGEKEIQEKINVWYKSDLKGESDLPF